MKKVLLCVAISSLINASEERVVLLNKTEPAIDINNMTSAGLQMQRAGWTDTRSIIRLFSDPETSRYAFGAVATDEQIKKHADSWGDLYKFALVLALEKIRNRNYFWTIYKQQDKQMIGLIGLEQCDDEVKKLLRTNNPMYVENYLSLSVILNKKSWNNGHAKNSVKKLLSTVFASPTFNTLHGVCCGVVDQDTRTIGLIEQDGQPKKPFSYLGDVVYPKGQSHIIPNPSVVKYYLINKDDFLQEQNNQNTNKN